MFKKLAVLALLNGELADRTLTTAGHNDVQSFGDSEGTFSWE
jgi:hypothetical protein